MAAIGTIFRAQGSSLVVWRGLVVVAEPADADHPYGHGKAEPIASAVVAGLLFLAAIWIAIHAVRKMGGHYFVDLHVEVDGDRTVREAHAIAHRVKDQVRAVQPRVCDVLVHVEPAR
jgi:divalent metal cation (Fe/Co/Zn/Cd) transporter